MTHALGIFGSIDANGGEMQCGWDTDLPTLPSHATSIGRRFPAVGRVRERLADLHG